MHKNDIQQIVPYILVEEAFQMIDIFMDASSHYGQAVDSSTYFELALLKICNQIENEHKEVVVEEPKLLKMFHMKHWLKFNKKKWLKNQ